MTTFKDFNIKAPESNFTGEKIKIDKVINTEIEVLDFKVEKGNFSDQRLVLQIEYKKEKRVIFSSSRCLIDMINQVPAGQKFTTTIIKDDSDRYQFS